MVPLQKQCSGLGLLSLLCLVSSPACPVSPRLLLSFTACLLSLLFIPLHSLVFSFTICKLTFFPSFLPACFFPSHTCLVPPVFSSLFFFTIFFLLFLSPSFIKFPSLRLCLLCPYILLYFSSQLQGALWWPQVVTGGSCSSQLMEDKMEIIVSCLDEKFLGLGIDVVNNFTSFLLVYLSTWITSS